VSTLVVKEKKIRKSKGTTKNRLSGISCVTILKYTLILSPQFAKSTENKTSNQQEN
jgi:hypothetical protein